MYINMYIIRTMYAYIHTDRNIKEFWGAFVRIVATKIKTYAKSLPRNYKCVCTCLHRYMFTCML